MDDDKGLYIELTREHLEGNSNLRKLIIEAFSKLGLRFDHETGELTHMNDIIVVVPSDIISQVRSLQ